MRYLVLVFVTFFLNASMINLPYSGVEVVLEDGKKFNIQRDVHSDCLDFGMEARHFWSDDFASKKISKNCKKVFITSKGIVQPIQFNEKIKTVGELEVLDFIKNRYNKNKNTYALVDVRPYSWYEVLTIPTAINVPYDELVEDELFIDDFIKNLQKLGIKKTKKGYDFTKAKEIILFCNGPWCSQSNKAMNSLIKLGYPQEKIFWYRGGLHDWTSMSFSVIKPK